jgi:hypothetical protein
MVEAGLEDAAQTYDGLSLERMMEQVMTDTFLTQEEFPASREGQETFPQDISH